MTEEKMPKIRLYKEQKFSINLAYQNAIILYKPVKLNTNNGDITLKIQPVFIRHILQFWFTLFIIFCDFYLELYTQSPNTSHLCNTVRLILKLMRNSTVLIGITQTYQKNQNEELKFYELLTEIREIFEEKLNIKITLKFMTNFLKFADVCGIVYVFILFYVSYFVDPLPIITIIATCLVFMIRSAIVVLYLNQIILLCVFLNKLYFCVDCIVNNRPFNQEKDQYKAYFTDEK